MNSWDTITMADLIDKGEANLQTGPFGTQLKANEYVESGIPVINVKNLGYGNVREDDLDFVDEKTAHRLSVHRLKTGDIVFGRKGSSDRYALIGSAGEGWVQGSDCMRLRLNSKQVTSRFLSYYFCTSGHKYWMEAVCSFGATMTTLNQGIVRRISLRLPPVEVQNKIAAILSTYDELIENNKRRIALLEKLAEEIYREWFVRLRFPGHENVKVVRGVPEGWEAKKLGSVLELCYGKALKEEDRIPGEYHVYGSGGVVGTHSEAMVKTPGLIVGRKGNVGSVYFADRGFFPIDTVYFVKSNLPNSFLYFLLRSMNFINNDAAVPGLNRSQAYSNQFFHPPDPLIREFAEVVDPQFEMKRILTLQNEKLGVTRDQLLPRLISGKLSVENLDIQFPPSMAEETEAVA